MSFSGVHVPGAHATSPPPIANLIELRPVLTIASTEQGVNEIVSLPRRQIHRSLIGPAQAAVYERVATAGLRRIGQAETTLLTPAQILPALPARRGR